MAKKPKYSIRDVLTEQERAQALAEMTIFSDIVATKFFDDTGITEYILRAVTGQQDLVVTEVKTRSIIDNPIGHSVRFDVLAKDAEGTLYDIEIQNVSGDDLLQRADYYGASMKVQYFEKRQSYSNVPRVYVVFFARDGRFCNGQLINHYFMRDDKNNDLNFGTRIYVVNGKLHDGSKVGKIMHDFSCTDPNEMQDEAMAERYTDIMSYKEEDMDPFTQMVLNRGIAIGVEDGRKEGKREGKREGMREGRKRGMREGRKEGRAEGRKEGLEHTALKLIQLGMPTDSIIYATGLTPSEIEAIQAKNGA